MGLVIIRSSYSFKNYLEVEMKRECRDYIDDLRRRSKGLKSCNIQRDVIDKKDNSKGQKEQDDLYKKYVFMDNLKKAIDKEKRKKDECRLKKLPPKGAVFLMTKGPLPCRLSGLEAASSSIRCTWVWSPGATQIRR